MKRALCLTTLGLAAFLTACGGATVDSEDVTGEATSTATSTESTATTESTAAASSAEGSTAASSGVPSRSNSADDQPAQEVESIPTQAPSFSAEEQAFLDHLRENGVNVEGVEDQLTATGFTVCGDDPITRDAVAGQLVEQRRTDMDAGQVAALISDTARANLCS